MPQTKEAKPVEYKNFLLSIFDMWQLLNQDIPKKIEDEQVKQELKEERERKLGSKGTQKANTFSPTEVSVIEELVSNPRKSYVSISGNLSLSRHTVKKKIEEMLKHDKIRFFLGINYHKLNLDLVILTIKISNLKYLDDLFHDLQNCPRVFSIIKDISKSCLQIIYGIEKSSINIANQCVNFIERIQLNETVKECSITYLYPEIFPYFVRFSPNNLPQKSSISPCEVDCSLCDKYMRGKCDGCPASTAYRGDIFSKL